MKRNKKLNLNMDNRLTEAPNRFLRLVSKRNAGKGRSRLYVRARRAIVSVERVAKR